MGRWAVLKNKTFMRVGFFIENKGHKDINLNTINSGNPGIGGSEYQSYILASYLTDFYPEIDCVLFTTNKTILDKSKIKNVIVENILDTIIECKTNEIDILIFNKHANVGICDLELLCNLIDEQKIKTITVGHNFYSKKECDLISKCKFIIKNVYVSRQQYYLYYDHEITLKSTYVYAFIPFNDFNIRNLTLDKNVTYTGSLTSTKGFHVLARNWKNILKKCPDANLFVIGSGKLYSRNTKLGQYNIAEKSYENLFIKYLLDNNGNLLKSVHFLGLLTRDEITEIYKKTLVGIINPSGISECCPVTSVEYQALGVPVVSKKYGGLLDTIMHKKTGLLFKSERIFVQNVVKLLKNYELNKKLGNHGYFFSRKYFSEKVNVPKWHVILNNTYLNTPNPPLPNNLIRLALKIYYKIKFDRPKLVRGESLLMPFNNYEKIVKRHFEIIEIRTKLKLVLLAFISRIKILSFEKFKGISASNACIEEIEIFNKSVFQMPLLKDTLENENTFFKEYQIDVPSFKVRVFKNAYFFLNQEEIFSANREVVLDYTSQKVNRFLGKLKITVFNKKPIKINETVAHLSLSGLENNYCHFLTECLARLYLIEKSGLKPDLYVISHNLPFQKEILDLIGIGSDKLILKDTNTLIKADKLIVADFINNWEPVFFRNHLSYQKQWLPDWIAKLYREKIEYQNSNKILPNYIYISREKANYRKIKNETDVVKIFKKFNFEVYYLEDLKIIDQIRLFNNAKFIAGLHGSGFTNMKFSNEGTIIFELYTKFYHDSSLRVQAHTLKMKYYYLIGDSVIDQNVHPQKEDTFINLESLEISLVKIFKENKEIL
jgi:glycosyltransferase involved in cell wall biosynthesis